MAEKKQEAKVEKVGEDKTQEQGPAKLEDHEKENQLEVKSFEERAAETQKLAEKLYSETVKFNDKGQVIGVDGENPVSNENPDPRAIRYFQVH